MKKSAISILLATALLTGALSGCGRKTETEPDPGEENTTVENPVTESDAQGVLDATGIGLSGIDGMEQVSYSVISVKEGNPIAQMDFTYGGADYCLRAQSTDETETVPDISGMYYTWETTTPVNVSYLSGTAFTAKDAGLVTWLDVVPGIAYSLSTASATSAQALAKVATAVFIPMQSEVDGTAPITGHFAYDAIVTNLREAMADNWNASSPEMLDVSYAFSTTGQEYPAGYAVTDINGDGVDELLLGVDYGDGNIAPLYDIFTLGVGDTAVHVAGGGERDRYYITGDGLVAREGSSGAANSFTAFYLMENYALALSEAVIYDAETDARNPWFYSASSISASAAKGISEAQAQEVLAAHAYADPGLTPLAGL